MAAHHKVLITTLTKRMAEDLTDYMKEARYPGQVSAFSMCDTLERAEIIRDMRLDVFDVLVGINLLREGLDIPEITLVAILDADKEGFLRSETSLIQTIGRAARNARGPCYHVCGHTPQIPCGRPLTRQSEDVPCSRPTMKLMALRRPRSKKLCGS